MTSNVTIGNEQAIAVSRHGADSNMWVLVESIRDLSVYAIILETMAGADSETAVGSDMCETTSNKNTRKRRKKRPTLQLLYNSR